MAWKPFWGELIFIKELVISIGFAKYTGLKYSEKLLVSILHETYADFKTFILYYR